MKITRQQLRRLIRESIDNNSEIMKLEAQISELEKEIRSIREFYYDYSEDSPEDPMVYRRSYGERISSFDDFEKHYGGFSRIDRLKKEIDSIREKIDLIKADSQDKTNRLGNIVGSSSSLPF